MKDLSTIGEELFNKIRGRFPSVTIGDEHGKVTNVPEDARFFDFAYSQMDPDNKVSITLDEKEGLSVLYNSDAIALSGATKKQEWYEFLRELRKFARKRLIGFDTRDIERNNLKKRDYKYLAKTPEDESMNESVMYGTARTSYQDVGNARLMIKHTQPVNPELGASRTMHIEGIYIESSNGERFKYPFKHVAGARAMARHVAEGGNAYDEFGQHVTGLSEELANLRKFKTYMNRSSVMAEGLSGYMDVVNERVAEVKERIKKLQRENYYKEAFEGFEKREISEVPEDVKQDWIAQLTVKQFNEELQDVFPYIYKLIGEAKPKELGPDEIVEKAGKIACLKCDGVSSSKAWEKNHGTCPKCNSSSQGVAETTLVTPEEKEIDEKFNEIMNRSKVKEDGMIYSAKHDDFQILDTAGNYVFGVENYRNGKNGWNIYKKVGDDQFKMIKNLKVSPYDKTGKARQIWLSEIKPKLKTGAEESARGAEDEKTPLPEFILSMFDKETGRFPKGETAILTSIEKDYGEQYINPAKQFIEKINNTFAEHSRRPKMNDVEQLADDQVTEKWRAPKNGTFTHPVEDPKTGADIELNIEWEVVDDYDGSSGVAFYASTPSGEEYHIDSKLEDALSQHLDSEMNGSRDDYGDYQYQRQRDDRFESINRLKKLSGL